MSRSRLLVVAAVLASFAWMLAGGCAANDAAPNGSTAGTGPDSLDASSDTMVSMQGASGMGNDGGDRLNPLCGEGLCLPDDPQSCRSYQPPNELGMGGASEGGATSGGAAGESAGGAGGMSGGAGLGGSPDTGTAGEGGASSGGAAMAGEAGGGGANGGNGGDGNSVPPGPASFGCQVTRGGNPAQRECQVAGTGKLNAPCFTGADCQAGLACVTQGEAGRCLRYCCGGDSTCDTGTYCAEQQLRKAPSDTSSALPPRVPVCVPADDCSLEDEYPCAADKECRCTGNTACMVVRSDRTTACVTPGAGQPGEPCPCDWNNVCSSVTQKCVKICHTDPAKDDCGTQKCQASAELPPNFGVCVGPVE